MSGTVSDVVVYKQRGGLSSRGTGEKRPKVDARWRGGAVTLKCKRMPFEVENLGIT